MTDAAHIYRIMSPSDWDAFQKRGEFVGAPHDIADGFIHFSSAAQLAQTARLHYRAPGDCIVLEVAVTALPRPPVWESSRGGDLFPHLYDNLPLGAVTQTYTLRRGADGEYIMPDKFNDDQEQ